MKIRLLKHSTIFSIAAFITALGIQAAYAQIIPDALGTSYTPNVNINGIPSDIINGGALRGNNLFHSFSEFNINRGRGVYFTNPTDVTNIFTRVTGANPSNINGTLGVLGNANLFLMNPNGIIFGTDAKLDIKGSFLGTTANSINFADGAVFNSTPNSVLTVSAPIGLGFGSTAPITVQGNGAKFSQQSLGFPLQINANSTGLQVNPGKTLALIGGNINLEGGVIKADARIELGSIENGKVGINISPSSGLTLDYTNTKNYSDIALSQTSLLDASGSSGGAIKLQGKNIYLNDNSVVLIQTNGQSTSEPSASNITVAASESLQLNRSLLTTTLQNLIVSQNLSTSKGADIEISAKNLLIKDGGTIITENFGTGKSGNITVNAENSIELNSTSPFDFRRVSMIGTVSNQGATVSGNVTVNTRQLKSTDGGGIGVLTNGGAGGGNITINASDSIDLIGEEPITSSGSFLTNVSFFGGNAGKLTVNTGRLKLQGGGLISTSTLASGNAGTIEINAYNSIEVTGKGTATQSRITASSEILPLNFQKLFGLPPIPSGMSGDISINTPYLTVSNGGTVTVNNQGTGDAGSLKINANFINLDNKGSISAATASGTGGNIYLQAQNLLLNNSSNITATAAGAQNRGNGGNITLNVGAVAQLNNSDITAQAAQGKGGNIQINTQGLFASSDSKISATGSTNGEIKISSPEVKQENALQEQSSQFANTENLVSTSCLATRNISQGKFVVTGNGGLPQTPNTQEISYEVAEIQAVSYLNSSQATPTTVAWRIGDRISEATELKKTSDGRLLLIVTATEAPQKVQNSSQSLICK